MAAITSPDRTYQQKSVGVLARMAGAKSVMQSNEAKWGYNEDLLNKSHPIFRRVLDMYNDSSIPGPFPMPGNLRFSELQDNWSQTVSDLFYGDVPFDEGIQATHDAMQEILDLPRA